MGIHYSLLLLLLKMVLVEPQGSRNICNQVSTLLTQPLSLTPIKHYILKNNQPKSFFFLLIIHLVLNEVGSDVFSHNFFFFFKFQNLWSQHHQIKVYIIQSCDGFGVAMAPCWMGSFNQKQGRTTFLVVQNMAFGWNQLVNSKHLFGNGFQSITLASSDFV